MTIENLIKVLPPPAKPYGPFEGPWEALEERIRTRLPDDYKALMRVYGEGQFMDFFGLYRPENRNPNVDLWRIVIFFSHQTDFGEPPAPLWPRKGGLLPCGQTDNGDFLFWLTRGPIAEWPIVVWGRGMQDFETFECDLTDFIAGVVTGEIMPRAFEGVGLEEVEEKEKFVPWDDEGLVED